MIRPLLVGTVLSALLPLACTSEQPPDPPPSATGDATSASSNPEPPSPDPVDPSGGSPAGSPCQVDADCAAGLRCELRICIAGCQADDECAALQTCDPHGRCEGTGSSAPPLAGPPHLAEYHTILPWGEAEARTALHNDGTSILLYRLESLSPAVLVDEAPAELAPGDTADLVAAVDRDLVDPSEHALTVRLVTSGGPGRWTIEPASVPEDSIFRGMVALDLGGLSVGNSDLAVALDFQSGGVLVGQTEPGSLLFPQPIAASGTWTPAGDVTLVLRDVQPAADWQQSAFARELGRTLILTGTVAADGRTIEGTVEETLTGLRDAPLEATGTFALRQHEPLDNPLAPPPQAVPEDILPPVWLAPDDFDDAACEGLGTTYGTPETLSAPSPACDACADGTCTPEQMLECGDALWTAAYQLPGVLAGLHGDAITPPSGSFTWTDCTAESPAYKDGATCLDARALRCATSLFRRGAPQIPGAWGEAFTHYAALLAHREAEAAVLLGTEATIDAAFAYKDDLGEPATDVLARELDILAGARERLAGALVPLLTPAYLDGLGYIRAHNPDDLPDTAATTELRLGTRLADLTAAWARLSLRAGDDPGALRGQLQRAAIDLHALALEAHARNAEDPAADFPALAATWATLALAFRDLGPDANPFGYAAAYVPMALGPEDIEQGRTNFDAIHAFAADDLTTFADLASAAWQAMRDYEEKTHSTQATALQLTADFDAKLRALCGALPGDTAPDLATCGQHGGQIAELDAAVAAAGLRIDQAVQTLENNHHAVAVEEERFATQAQAIAELGAVLDALHEEIFAIVDEHGENRTMMMQFQALSECSHVQRAAKEQMDVIRVECKARVQKELLSGPAIFGFSTPDWRGIHLARKACEAEKEALAASTQAQCDTILGQAGLQTYLEDQARQEQVEIMAVNAEIDAAIRETDLKIAHAASIALIKNLRAEALLLALEIREAEIAREATLTALWSAYGEVAALTLEKARALGLLVDDDPNNALVRPHFLAARQHAASRVLRAREHLTRRLYLALRALEYDLGQPLPTLRDQLLTARAPEDFTALLSCLDSIAEDYRLTHGYGQAYTTEVSLRADVFGIAADLPDVDGTPATPAEQFQALLHDPAHRQLDGTIALPFTLSATPGHTLFSTWLCDDRLDQIEVKLIGDYLGDREAEVLLTRQGLATVRRCDAVNLAPSVAHAEYSFDREQVVLQAGVGEWGPPNAGFAAWPVHGEQWTLTIPPASQSPANADLDADDIADVVLRLHHRASTLAPEGQGLFTPSCG